MKKPLSCVLAAAITAAMLPTAALGYGDSESGKTATIKYNYDGETHERQMEKLDRGLIAVKTSDGVFLSWRLLGDEYSVAQIYWAESFDVYKNGKYLATVEDSTNYLDRSGTASDTYYVQMNGGEASEPVTVKSNSYFDIPVVKPADFTDRSGNTYSYTIGDTSCGDFDGDGEYELVVKWDCHEQDNSNGGDTGNVYLDAYKLDGTRVWKDYIDLGVNIRGGAHYTQFLVYDFDGDGKAEITCRTAPGSKGTDGNYVTAVSTDSTIKAADNTKDYRNDSGYILEGPEYFTIFKGETGEAIDTINYPTERISASVWGDSYGNRVDRFVADVAYMDGERPYAVYLRGYYFGQSGYQGRTGIFAASFDGERLSVPETHMFDTRSGQPGYTTGNEQYVGEGNHNMTMADVDDDGKDEIMIGGLCVEFDDNDKLMPKWCTYREHGDAIHIGDYDPTHKGLELFVVHEDGGGTNTYGNVALDFGASVIDPETGEIIWHQSAPKDTGRGLMANVGAGGYYQVTGSSGVGGWVCYGGSNFVSGTAIGYNFRIFWDADLYDETLDGTTISSWNGSRMAGIFTADGCTSINGTKAVPALQADLFGDWREEVVYPLSDNSALRVFTTTDITEYKLPTLMHDPVYRSGVAAEQSGYNQPPHIGFYLADEIFRQTVDYIEITKAPNKTSYLIGEALDTTGLVVTAYFADGTSEEVEGYVVSGYDALLASEQSVSVTYGKKTAVFTVDVQSGFTIDENGIITGYVVSNKTPTLPETINGIKVTGIAAGALAKTSITNITIYSEELTIGENAFPSGVNITCYLGSSAYIYAVENGISCSEIDTRDYTSDITYSETGYSSLNFFQEGTSKTTAIGNVTYGVGGRTNRGVPGGDGNTGFGSATVNGEAVLNCSVGRFYGNGRQAYFILKETPKVSDATDNVFQTDIYFKDNSGRKAQMRITDSSNNVIDTVSAADLGLETDTWYTYKLVYHQGKYYRCVSVVGETGELKLIDDEEHQSEYGAVRFDFFPSADSSGIGNNQSAQIYLDNTKVYTNPEIVNLTVKVTDKAGFAVQKPVITINSTQHIGDENGIYTATVAAGIYNITVTAEGYDNASATIGAIKSEVEKTIELNLYGLSGISVANSKTEYSVGEEFDKNSLTVTASYSGGETELIPGDKYVITDYNAYAAGEQTVTVNYGGFTDTFVVTVKSGFEIDSSGYITGYNGDETDAVLPESINKTAVNGIKKGALADSVLKKITIYATELDIGKNALPKDAAIVCYLGSDAYIYAAANGISYEIIETRDYSLDIDYSEAEYNDFGITMSAETQPVTIGAITYGTGSRGGGDSTTGIYKTIFQDESVLNFGVGKFSNSNRNPYFEINTDYLPELSDEVDTVFESDLYFTTNNSQTAVMQVTDSEGSIVDKVSVSNLGLEYNTWYTYKLIYHKGTYYRNMYKRGNETFAADVITSQTSAYGPVRFDFMPESSSTDSIPRIYVDNTKVYTGNEIQELTINVKDGDGSGISNAVLTVGGATYDTDRNGKYTAIAVAGAYDVTAAAEGYPDKTVTIGIVDSAVTKDIVFYVSKLQQVSGNKITVTAERDGLMMFAVRYENGLLKQINVFEVDEGTQTETVDFVPEKVFLWTDGLVSIDKYIK